MVRGNWQRRVELTASARQAYKLQKESRRNKQQQQQRQQQYRTSISSSGIDDSYYRRLEQWLDEKGDEILRLGRQCDNNGIGADETPISVITVDLWTHSTPTNRPEYSIFNEHYLEDIYCNDCVDINDKGGEGRGKGSLKKDQGKVTSQCQEQAR